MRDLKNNDLYILQECIKGVRHMGGNAFKLPIILNEELITKRIEVLEKLIAPSERFAEYQIKSRELYLIHAEKEGENLVLYSQPDGQGVRVSSGMGFPKIITDPIGYGKKKKKLDEEYKDSIDEHNEKAKAFEATLAEPCDLELKKIPFDVIPDLGYDELKVLMWMV